MKKDQKTIYVIDDEPILRQSLLYFLEDQGFLALSAVNGREGIDLIKKTPPDAVLTDLRMPEVDGLEVLEYINANCPEIPTIVISGANRLDDAIQALRLGAWDFLIKPIHDLSILNHTLNNALEQAELVRENKIHKKKLESLVAKRTEELAVKKRQLEISRRQIIGILSQASDYRDSSTGSHFVRVSQIAGCLAQGLGYPESFIHLIRLVSPVHDIGKIGIPDKILLKEDRLNHVEREVMEQHCHYGNNILKTNTYVDAFSEITGNNVSQEIIDIAAKVALNHHERWDGRGYPLGLEGENIPIEARITAVADVYDALYSKRPYKDPWPHEKCVNYIKDQAGKQFDPKIVKVFLENLPCILGIEKHYCDNS